MTFPSRAIAGNATPNMRPAIAALLMALGACATSTPRTWEIPSPLQATQLNGYDMAYREHGTGTTVVFVHGTVTDYRYWYRQMEPIGEHYRAIAVSLRHYYPERWNGQGEGLSAKQHIADLKSFVRSLGAGKVHLVGISRGGQLALQLAAEDPDLLRSVVLADPAPIESLIPASAQSALEVKDRQAYVADAIELLRRGEVDAGMERFVDGTGGPGTWKSAPDLSKQVVRDNAWTISSLAADARESVSCTQIRKITVPVLLVTGEKSPGIYGVMLDAVQPCLMDRQRITIANAGQSMHLQNAPAFNAALLAFLSKH